MENVVETNVVKKVIKKDKKKYEWNVFSIILCVSLIIYTISFIIPLFWGLITSLKSSYQFEVMGDVIGLPNIEMWNKELDKGIRGNIFGSYIIALRDFQVYRKTQYVVGVWNQRIVQAENTANMLECTMHTLIYALGTTLSFLVVTVSVGYLAAKYRYPFSDFIYAVVIFCIVMPLTNTQPAMIELLRQLRIFNTHFSMLLTGASFRSMYFLIFYGFFKDLPNTYNEAAEIDGASQFATMVKICIPLASKMISTILLIQFVHSWNNYTTPMMYLPTKHTLAYAVYYAIQYSGSTAMKLDKTTRKVTCLMALAVPILILFIFLKNKLMGNISIGGIKE